MRKVALEQMFTLLSSDISVVTCKWIIEYIARPNDLKKNAGREAGNLECTVADRCHDTSRATRVLYSTAHESLARARARACTI